MNGNSGVRQLQIFVSSFALASALMAGQAAADGVSGRVLGGGAPVANSTVTLWAATAGAPAQLGQAKTDSNGQFSLTATAMPATDASLYLVAKGGKAAADKSASDNPAIALLAVVGGKAPTQVTINEFTTVASVWTHNQFIDGTAIKGHALGLRIAAGNVPNFVDLETGGYGVMIQDDLNSTETPTMANFATLANVMAGCTTRVKADACNTFFVAATGRDGKAPTDTLTAAISIAHNMAYKPERVFGLLDAFYPVPPGKHLRGTPFMPYLNFVPSAWVLPLKFSGGGNAGGAKVMFDSEGNAWSGDNFLVGWQGHDNLWPGNLSKFASNGKPLSPMTTGFTGGGLLGPGFGTAIDANDRVWVDNTSGQTISLFDKSGKGMAIDSRGNAWVTNTMGRGMTLETKLRLLALKLRGTALPAFDRVALQDLVSHPGLGSVSMLRPDGSPAPGSPFNPGSIWGAWAVSIDGNDHAWISNFAPGGGITELCGARTETCPAGMKTGDPISPPGGYKGGGMQLLVDASIDPAGNVWVSNNWQDQWSCYGTPDEGVSTRCGGHGLVVFYGMAKPVRAPQIGPARPY